MYIAFLIQMATRDPKLNSTTKYITVDKVITTMVIRPLDDSTYYCV